MTIVWHVGDIGMGVGCAALEAYRAYTLALGPIHYWEMQEPAASPDPDDTVAVDLGSLDEDGGCANIDAYQVEGPDEGCVYAMRFSNTGNGRIETDSPGQTANSLPGDFTVCAWVKINSAALDNAFHIIVSNEVNASPEFKWAMSLDTSSRLNVRTFRDNLNSHLTASWASGTVADVWFFVVGRLDDAGEVIELWIDGALEATDNTPTGTRVSPSTETVTISSPISTFGFTGDIALVSLFDYQLTDQNIEDLFAIIDGA